MTYIKKVVFPTLEAIVMGFIITSLILAIPVFAFGFPYLPLSILLGNVIGSLPWFVIRHRTWKRESKAGLEF
jgi:hypothetical protein